MTLPAGVSLLTLTPHADDRGIFTELYRASWEPGITPVQWNAVRSEANVLRGVHVHRRHTDYMTVVSGAATIGLHDLRPGSTTEGVGATVELDARAPQALVIPSTSTNSPCMSMRSATSSIQPMSSGAAGTTRTCTSRGRARSR